MKIIVNQKRPFPQAVFEVVVRDKNGSTNHRVGLDEGYYKKLTGESTVPEKLVRKSFEFLLEREPKESILREFDLPTIQKYFPEYESCYRK